MIPPQSSFFLRLDCPNVTMRYALVGTRSADAGLQVGKAGKSGTGQASVPHSVYR